MAGESSDFGASIAELQAVLLGTDSIDGFLRELASLAVRTLGRRLPARTPIWPTITPAAAGPVPATCRAAREVYACAAVVWSQPPVAGQVADLAVPELSGRAHSVVVPG